MIFGAFDPQGADLEAAARGARASVSGFQNRDIGLFSGFGEALIEGPQHAGATALTMLAAQAEPYAKQYTPDVVADAVSSVRKSTYRYMQDTRADGSTMGAASELVHGLGSILTAGVIGAAGGVPGVMASIGTITGYSKAKELQDQGVDASTAELAGTATGVAMGVGAGLAPFYGSTLVKQLLSAAGINVGLGMMERGATKEVLEADYPQMAKHYNMMDGKAMFLDAVIGAVFPLGYRLMGKGKTDGLPEPKPGDLDTAMQAQRTISTEHSTPAYHTTPDGLAAERASMQEFTRQIIEDGKNPLDVTLPENALADTVMNGRYGDMAAETAQAIDTAMRNVYGETASKMDETLTVTERALQSGEDASIAATKAVEPEVKVGADGTAVARSEDQILADRIATEPVYHGTLEEFDSISTEGLGAHFAEDRSISERFGEGGRVIAVYLDIKNPLRIVDHGGTHTNAEGVARQLIDDGVLPSNYVDDAFYSRIMKEKALGNSEQFTKNNLEELERIKKILKGKGYDGLVYENVAEGGGRAWVAFDESQIHSSPIEKSQKPGADKTAATPEAGQFTQAQAREALTLNDIPPEIVQNVKVKVEQMIGDEIRSVEIPALKALDDVKVELSAYKKLLDCVRGA